MKKLDHEQRVELAKSRIIKSSSHSKKKLTLRQKKIASLIGSSTVAVAAAAGISVAVALEANKDRRIEYPTSPNELHAADFIYDKNNENANIWEENVGSQSVVYAKKGPINFVSNYKMLMNKDKLTDWLNWFYHDVSWGPEISTLSNISFLSGVQASQGQITLGYHTGGRDSNTIVLSPDFQVSHVNPENMGESLAYIMYERMNSELMNTLTPGIKTKYKDMAYRMLTHGNLTNAAGEQLDFQYTFAEFILNDLRSLSSPKAFYKGDVAGAPASIQINHLLPTGSNAIPVKEDLPAVKAGVKKYRVQDLLKSAHDNWSKASFTDKVNWFKLIGINTTTYQSKWKAWFDFTKPADEGKLDALFQNFIDTDFFKSAVSLRGFLSNNPKFPNGHNEFNADGTLGTDARAEEYNNFYKFVTVGGEGHYGSQIAWLSDVSKSRTDVRKFHLDTLTSLISFSNDEYLVKKALAEFISMVNISGKLNKNEKIAAVLSVVNHYLSNNVIASGVTGKTTIGDHIMFDLYKKLSHMSEAEIDSSINADFLYKYLDINGDYMKTIGYTPEDLKVIKHRKDFINQEYTSLAKHLDEKYHSGKHDPSTGKRIPGIPVWKPGDTMYDSTVRRSSQDIMYTVSHEYGHHTTLFHAQDISAYDGETSIGSSTGATEAVHPNVLYNSEVVTAPSFEQMASGEKYGIFRDAFAPNAYFQDVLDRGSDGDSRTDISIQLHNDILNIDFKTVVIQNDVITLEKGIERYGKGEIHNVRPQYFGQTKTGFDSVNVPAKLADVLQLIRSDTPNHPVDWTHLDTLLPSSVNAINSAYEILKDTLKSTDREFQRKSVNDGNKITFPTTAAELKKYLLDGIDNDSNWYASETLKYVDEDDSENTKNQPYVYPLLLEMYQDLLMKGEDDEWSYSKNLSHIEKELIREVSKEIYLSDSTVVEKTPDTSNADTPIIVHLKDNPDQWNAKVKAKLEAYKLAHPVKFVQLLTALKKFEEAWVLNGVPFAQLNSVTNKWEEVDSYEDSRELYYSNKKSHYAFFDAFKAIFPSDHTLTLDSFLTTYITSALVAKKDVPVSASDPSSGTVSHWELASGATIPSASSFDVGTFNTYLKYIFQKSLDEIHANGLDSVLTPSGEIVTRNLYTDAGVTTKKLFDNLFSRQTPQNSIKYNNKYTDEDGEHTLDMNFGRNIDDKFTVWHVFIEALRTVRTTSFDYGTFEAALTASATTPINVRYNSRDYKISLDANFVTNIIKPIFSTDKTVNPNQGGVILPMTGGPKSVGSVVYVFNKPEDSRDYNTIFSTVSPGAVPPKSDIRYSTFYSETLTRAFNQIAFTQFPELTPTLGAYLDEDRTRFLSFGIQVYKNDIPTPGAGDTSLTATGIALRDMYKKFYSTNKELAEIVRNHQSGKYTFIGFSDTKNKYKELVFTDVSGNIIAHQKMVYGVDNYHYYEKFADPTTIQKLTTRVSWMTEFVPLGNWKNTFLNEGNYKIKFWEDKNNDGKMDDGELIPLLNKQVTGDGQLNNNGKSDNTAEIIGNPDTPNPFGTGKTQKEKQDYKDAEYIFRVTNILL